MKTFFIYVVICVIHAERSEALFCDHLENILESTNCIRSDNGSYSYQCDSPIGPDCWSVTYPQCAGASQSPINIIKSHTKPVHTRKRLVCSKWTEKPELIQVTNTGKTIEMHFEYHDGTSPILYPQPLSTDQYVFDSVHIHFIGSEHTFNHNEKFSIEAHLVFYNLKYGSIENAVNFKDGLMVIGKFYKEQIGADAEFTFIHEVEEVDSSITLTGNQVFTLAQLFGSIKFNFYAYSGSLTTPACYEAVTFILDDTPLKISYNTIELLDNIKGDDGYMSPNIRPIQPTNGRTIYYYKC